MIDEAVRLHGVVVDFGPRARIGPVDLTVGAGEILGLIGANGSGKTTLMRAMCALQPLTDGRIDICGQQVISGRPVAGVGAIIEEPRFYPWLSARRNLLLAAAARPAWTARIALALGAVGLDDVADVTVAEFSQGMRQRLGLARALLGDPRVLILDEPTNGLDATAITAMRDLVREQARSGTTVVISSHLLTEVQVLADSLLVMRAGRVIARDTTQRLMDRHGTIEALMAHSMQ